MAWPDDYFPPDYFPTDYFGPDEDLPQRDPVAAICWPSEAMFVAVTDPVAEFPDNLVFWSSGT